MSDFHFTFDDKNLIEAYARLKKIPVAKVIRNATKDFVQAAFRTTPIAKVSKSKYFVVVQHGRKRFLHEKQVRPNTTLHRMRVAKGWSKATWIGIMRALHMKAKEKPSIVPDDATAKSTLQVMEQANLSATAIVQDEIRFDHFGKGNSDSKLQEIANAGFKLAAERITKDMNRTVQKLWGNK